MTETQETPAGRLWGPDDYEHCSITGSGASKLADSAVAPLVAAARGYATISGDKVTKAMRATFQMKPANNPQSRRLDPVIEHGGDLLWMPWFTPRATIEAEYDGRKLAPSYVQFRPSKPLPYIDAKTGKEKLAKYDGLGGVSTPLGLHPSYTATHIKNAPTVLVAEGLLKGDSALTAHLLDCGFTKKQLKARKDETTIEARERLRGLLELIEEEHQILIIGIVGAYNWRFKEDWYEIHMRDRNFLIGFDADVSANAQVWAAANEMFRMLKKNKANVSLLRPILDDEAKAGLDDYFAEGRTWEDLANTAIPELPPRPEGAHALGAKWRVNKDGVSISEKIESRDGDGESFTDWKQRLPYGGRISSFGTRRIPSERENVTGVVDPPDLIQHGAEEIVEIDVSFADPVTSEEITETVVGPAKILSEPPEMWGRRGEEVSVPQRLRLHPQWPPRGNNNVGVGFMQAIKTHRASERRDQVVWNRFGWLPSFDQSLTPVFAIGDDIICDSERRSEYVVDVSSKMSGANNFGLGEPDDRPIDDPNYLADVKRDVLLTLTTLIKGGAFKDQAHAWLALAAAVRPAIPADGGIVLHWAGPPNSGKSYSAGVIMGFWSARPGVFTNQKLPGSADDTAVATEMALSRSPIWVVDDLTPASSKQKADAQQDKIDNIVRMVHDNKVHRRSTADTTGERASHPAYTKVLLLTSENKLNLFSAQNRVLTIDVTSGEYLSDSMENTNELDHLYQVDGAPARMMRGFVRWLQGTRLQYMCNKGLDPYSLFNDRRRKYQKEIAERIALEGANSTRVAATASHLWMSLWLMLTWCHELGLIDELDRREIWFNEQDPSSGFDSILRLAQERMADNQQSKLSTRLIESLAACLSSGAGHVINAESPDQPPGWGKGDSDADKFLATQLGWDVMPDGTGRPKGARIGALVHLSKVSGTFAVFQRDAAFNVAARNYPNLIPAGTNSSNAWGEVWSDKIATEGLGTSAGKSRTTVQIRFTSTNGDYQRVSGIPVSVNKLFNFGPADDE